MISCETYCRASCQCAGCTADFYAQILDALRTNGTPIPTNDIWIAAIAFQKGLKLYTRDSHFSKIPGINLLE